MGQLFEVRDGAATVGSFSGDQIRQLAADGTLHARMEIRRLPAGEWSHLSNAKGLQCRSPTKAPAVAASSAASPSHVQAVPTPAPADFDALAVNLLSQAAAAAPTEIECPYCSELIKATAKKCKHCGDFLEQSPTAARGADDVETGSIASSSHGSTSMSPQAGPNRALAMILAFLFGPIGLLYATVTGGLVMLFVTILLALLIDPAVGILTSLACVIIAAIATSPDRARSSPSSGGFRYSVSKTIKRDLPEREVFAALEEKCQEGINNNLGGVNNSAHVVFSVKRKERKTIMSAAIVQRPTIAFVVFLLLGIFLAGVGALIPVVFYYLGKGFVTREIQKIFDEVADELS